MNSVGAIFELIEKHNAEIGMLRDRLSSISTTEISFQQEKSQPKEEKKEEKVEEKKETKKGKGVEIKVEDRLDDDYEQF